MRASRSGSHLVTLSKAPASSVAPFLPLLLAVASHTPFPSLFPSAPIFASLLPLSPLAPSSSASPRVLLTRVVVASSPGPLNTTPPPLALSECILLPCLSAWSCILFALAPSCAGWSVLVAPGWCWLTHRVCSGRRSALGLSARLAETRREERDGSVETAADRGCVLSTLFVLSISPGDRSAAGECRMVVDI